MAKKKSNIILWIVGIIVLVVLLLIYPFKITTSIRENFGTAQYSTYKDYAFNTHYCSGENGCGLTPAWIIYSKYISTNDCLIEGPTTYNPNSDSDLSGKIVYSINCEGNSGSYVITEDDMQNIQSSRKNANLNSIEIKGWSY
jgi:hypothetical protein